MRRKKEEKKEARAIAAEKNKIYKPGECMKHMTIEVHPGLSSEWYMAELPREAARGGARVSSAAALCDRNLILWSRCVPTTLSDQLGLNSKEQCDRALYVQLADDVAWKVVKRELSAHVTAVRDMAACRLTLVVFGAKDYFKTTGRKTLNSSRKMMTEIDFEMAKADLLVSAECDTVLVETPNELGLLIVQFTKAIAEAPHKQAKRALDEQAEFYMRGDNKKCVRVDSNGNGLSGLWQQMVAILPNSSLETSRAVCAQYRSPLELYEALQSPDGVTSLAEVPIARSAVANSRSRRLGPEFARKMKTLLTAGDGNILIE
ncbi:crossover junction endonuclease EME1 isoform X2 [Plodia interpunctella]|nr:crossover junction endonuclease EME1 isoform X2 [Plodia interpunctella]